MSETPTLQAWQANCEGAALVFAITPRRDRAIVPLHDLLYDRKAKPTSQLGLDDRIVHPVKPVKQAVFVFFGEPDARIGNVKMGLFFVSVQHHGKEMARFLLTSLIAKENAEGVSVLPVIKKGDNKKGDVVTPTLITYAEEHDIDLIVMASHGHTGLKHFLLGSVTERVSRASPCPVLVVKEKERKTPLHAA